MEPGVFGIEGEGVFELPDALPCVRRARLRGTAQGDVQVGDVGVIGIEFAGAGNVAFTVVDFQAQGGNAGGLVVEDCLVGVDADGDINMLNSPDKIA